MVTGRVELVSIRVKLRSTSVESVSSSCRTSVEFRPESSSVPALPTLLPRSPARITNIRAKLTRSARACALDSDGPDRPWSCGTEPTPNRPQADPRCRHRAERPRTAQSDAESTPDRRRTYPGSTSMLLHLRAPMPQLEPRHPEARSTVGPARPV